MRSSRVMLGALAILAGLDAGGQAGAGPLRHHGYVRYGHHRHGLRYARLPTDGAAALTVSPGGTLPPELARFAGFPYNMPGYRYDYADACFFRLGGPFGEGPSAGPCPFDLPR